MPGTWWNLGNALAAPTEGEWGLVLEAEHFRLIRQAGFDMVRIPIRWSAHAQTEPPYTIDPAFFERIDWVLDQARRQRLIAMINMHHYDEPFQFTHQGAEWVNGSSAWMGTVWEGKGWEQATMRADLDIAKQIADQNGWQLYMGEFGAYSKADMASRVRWTSYLVQEAQARGIAWSYWEFGAGFGVYDCNAGAWRKELLRALIPDSPLGE